MKNVKIIGLQRSGTNYLENLVKLNFRDAHVYGPGDISICWKHGMPTEKTLYETGDRPLTGMGITNIVDNNVHVILIEKPKRAWIDSMKRNKVDLEEKRPRLYKNGNINEVDALKFHDKFHKDWISALSTHNVKFIHVNYIDLLEDYERKLAEIQVAFKLTPSLPKFNDVHKVLQSSKFNAAKKEEYIKKYKN